MGQPAEPSPSQRLAIRALAQQVIEAVTADERLPHGLIAHSTRAYGRMFVASDVEDLLTKLCGEIVALTDDLKRETANADNLHDLLKGNDLQLAFTNAATERERVRGLLGQACDELDDTGGECARDMAESLRRQGGVE